MTPSDALKARRSSSGERVRNTPVPILACDAHACLRGPPHGSRRSINQRVAVPAVAIPATRWAECGGPLLTTTCGWNRRITERARSAARNTQPRLSSGKARNAATSLRTLPSKPWNSVPGSLHDPSGNDASDCRTASRRSRRQASRIVQKRGHDSTEACSGGAAVITLTSQPNRTRYFVMPVQRKPPTAPLEPK